MQATAARSPCWSRSALPRGGGPCGRSWRKGRSQRSTINPTLQKASASVTRSGALQFDPAPCASTRQSPTESAGRCRNPRTGTSFGESSRNSWQLQLPMAAGTFFGETDHFDRGNCDQSLFDGAIKNRHELFHLLRAIDDRHHNGRRLGTR
jgi:hypothetical protein